MITLSVCAERQSLRLPAGWRYAYPAYGWISDFAAACRVALRLPGLRMNIRFCACLPGGATLTRPVDGYPSLRLPAGWRYAYPAYGWISDYAAVCRVALCLPGLWMDIRLCACLPGDAALIRPVDGYPTLRLFAGLYGLPFCLPVVGPVSAAPPGRFADAAYSIIFSIGSTRIELAPSAFSFSIVSQNRVSLLTMCIATRC